MMLENGQKTVGKRVSFSGIALHTGKRAHLTLSPAPENTGIIFKRTDIHGTPSVRALANNVVDVRRGTTIAEGNAKVYTVEHVLSSLSAAEIDNALVEMDGPEPPIADGSAMPYLEMIIDAGIARQNAPAQYWTTKEPIVVRDKDTELVMVPDSKLRITCIVSYGVTPLDCQYYSNEINYDIFHSELASSRTFCMFGELEQLIALGLVKGGSLDNAVVLHNGAIISKEGLRYHNELARHKVLDIIGDISLVGKRVKAHIIAVKPGHPTNVALAQKMLHQNKSTLKAA